LFKILKIKTIALFYLLLTPSKIILPYFSHGGHKITMDQAQSILGEKCKLIDQTNANDENGHRFSSTYLVEENKSKALFYVFESFKNYSLAKIKFIEFYEGNMNKKRFEELDSDGDQAFFLSDNENFALLIIRKNNELIRLKVNKISSTSSKNNLIKVGNSIAARM
jgi:hypothetical protein